MRKADGLSKGVCAFSGRLGVSVHEILRIVNNNQLTGAIPDIFLGLTGLVNLDFSSYNFSGPLPASMSNLTSLSSLNLQNNMLSGTVNNLADLHLTDLYGGNWFDTSPAPPPPSSISPSSPRSPGHNSSSGKSSHDERKSKYLTSGRIAGIAVAGLLTVIAVVLIIMFFVTRKHDTNSGVEKKYKGRDKYKNEEKIFYKDV